MTSFATDTLKILFLLAMLVLSLAVNAVTTTLQILIQIIVAYTTMVTLLFRSYGGMIKAVLNPPVEKASGTIH